MVLRISQGQCCLNTFLSVSAREGMPICRLTNWPLGDVAVISNVLFSNSFDGCISWALPMKLLSCKYHRTRWHLASPDHYELTLLWAIITLCTNWICHCWDFHFGTLSFLLRSGAQKWYLRLPNLQKKGNNLVAFPQTAISLRKGRQGGMSYYVLCRYFEGQLSLGTLCIKPSWTLG